MSDQPAGSLPPAYFDDVYAAHADPWQFASSPYEAAKYAATLRALPRARYRSAFEIGCSIGVLTRQLAERCDRLLSVDVAEVALTQARERCRDQPHVRFASLQVPEQLPDGTFDLIVVSEVGYYWSPGHLRRAQDGIASQLEPDGHLLLVHWTPHVPDYPLTGDAVHDSFLARPEFRHLHGERADTYRLDVLTRTSPSGAAG